MRVLRNRTELVVTMYEDEDKDIDITEAIRAADVHAAHLEQNWRFTCSEVINYDTVEVTYTR